MKQNDVAVLTLEEEEADVLDPILPQRLVSFCRLWIFTSIPIPKCIKSPKSANDFVSQLYILDLK